MTLTTTLKYRILFALLALFAIPPALADSDDYLKGYLDALLDLQFPDNTVAVSALRHERGEAVPLHTAARYRNSARLLKPP